MWTLPPRPNYDYPGFFFFLYLFLFIYSFIFVYVGHLLNFFKITFYYSKIKTNLIQAGFIGFTVPFIIIFLESNL